MIHLDERIAQSILDYNWDNERKDFRGSFDIDEDIVVENLADCQKWIKWAEDEADQGTHHAFYDMLKLQEAIFLSKIKWKSTLTTTRKKTKVTGAEMCICGIKTAKACLKKCDRLSNSVNKIKDDYGL